MPKPKAPAWGRYDTMAALCLAMPTDAVVVPDSTGSKLPGTHYNMVATAPAAWLVDKRFHKKCPIALMGLG